MAFQHNCWFHKFLCDKIQIWAKDWGVWEFREIRGTGGGERGMDITGSDEWKTALLAVVLYERDREESQSKEMTWKRDSHNEREVKQPLKRTLRLTPSHLPPFSICKYSTSLDDTPLIAFDVILFIFIKSEGAGEEKTFGLPWSHNCCLMLKGKYSVKECSYCRVHLHVWFFGWKCEIGCWIRCNFFFILSKGRCHCL